jgi:hypothetical protein
MEHPELLVVSQALEESTGRLASRENGLNMLYKQYPAPWIPGNLEGGLTQRRGFANFFLVAQAKMSSTDISLE